MKDERRKVEGGRTEGFGRNMAQSLSGLAGTVRMNRSCQSRSDFILHPSFAFIL